MPKSDTADSRSAVVVQALHTVGYEENHFEHDWPILNRAGLASGQTSSTPLTLDLVAFCDDLRHDWNTSAIVCDMQAADAVQSADRGQQECRRLFEATAAPTVLFANHEVADLWIKCWDEPHRVPGIALNRENICRAFQEHRSDVEREALARLRGGQRYLFDRVYHARRDELAHFLHAGLEQAVDKLRREMGDAAKAEKEQFEEFKERLSHVAMALLAARIFEDKNYFSDSEEQSRDAKKLLKLAESKSNGFFRRVIDDDLAKLHKRFGANALNEILQRTLAHLTGPACFSLVTPEMLGDLYERALVANGHGGRKVNLKGIHYTPLSLAKHILRRIPIEELPPSRRYIADFACGSGSFLLAATERLRDAFDANEADAEDTVLEHVQARVIGNDQDPIAILVARMRYLLTHWIENRTSDGVPTPNTLLEENGLNLTPNKLGGISPSVVVGNPPFQKSGHYQMANHFLRKAIELLAPGGFLGMIMPAGFLKMRRQRCPETRRKLLETCELLEVWELPQGAVGLAARQAPCVIIARKTGTIDNWEQGACLFKSGYSAQAEAVNAVREHARSTWTFVADSLPGREGVPWLNDTTYLNKYRLIASPLDEIWRRVDLTRTLGQICVGQSGTGIDLGKKGVYSPTKESQEFEAYLQNQDRLRPYFVLRQDWFDDPNTRGRFIQPTAGHRIKRPLWELFRSPKVIVRCDINRNARIQVVAAFDSTKVFPEHHFRCFSVGVPSALTDWARNIVQSASKQDVLFWLTAIINSPIGHAWIAMSSPPRGMHEDVLHSLPIPDRFDERIAGLVAATKDAERPGSLFDPPLWSMWSDRLTRSADVEYQALVGQIHFLLFKSYGLSQRDFKTVNKYLEGMTNPWVTGSADAHIPRYAERRISGTVVSITIPAQKIVLDLPRYSRKTGPIEIVLPNDIPGWALRDGVGFTCLAPRDLRDPGELRTNPWLLRDFRPVPYSYLSASELDQLVATTQT